jgi:hypothetical protein
MCHVHEARHPCTNRTPAQIICLAPLSIHGGFLNILQNANLVGLSEEVSEFLEWRLGEASFPPQIRGQETVGLQKTLECGLNIKIITRISTTNCTQKNGVYVIKSKLYSDLMVGDHVEVHLM